MPTQLYTIAKIGGQSAEVILAKFQSWHGARMVADDGSWLAEQWPTDMREEADAFAKILMNHAHEPPVLFYCSYVDQWSFHLPHVHFSEQGLLEIHTGERQLGCLSAPLNKVIRGKISSLRTTGQFSEDRFFAGVCEEADRAWESMVGPGVVVFIREPLTSSVTDEEVEASLQITAGWIEKLG